MRTNSDSVCTFISLDIVTHNHTKKSHTVLSKFTVLCWATFIATLGHMRPVGCRLDTSALLQVAHPPKDNSILLFGSTYTCEQLFSRMKHIKSKIRTKISDELLENSLRIATASIKPDIDAPVSQLQGQTSH